MFLALLAVIGLALGRVRSLAVLDRMLDRLEDRSAQLRVRAALTLALAFAVLADRFGFASILGAFAAGLLVRTIDLTGRAPHPQFQVKLEGIGFGFLIPVFFITTGVQFDVRALVSNVTAIAEVPLFLAALLVVRAVPALLYARRFGQRRAGVAGLMQATTLTFVIVATQIGIAAGQISPATGASLLAAGLLSAALFPAAALKLLSAEAPAAGARVARRGGSLAGAAGTTDRSAKKNVNCPERAVVLRPEPVRAERSLAGDLVLLEQAAADDHLLDLGGALADQQHRHLPVQTLDLVLLGEAVAAVDAEGVLHDLLGVLRRQVLGHAGLQVVAPAESFRRAAITIIWWAASTLMPISASLKEMAWCWTIGLPKL